MRCIYCIPVFLSTFLISKSQSAISGVFLPSACYSLKCSSLTQVSPASHSDRNWRTTPVRSLEGARLSTCFADSNLPSSRSTSALMKHSLTGKCPVSPALEGGVKGNLPAKADPIIMSTFPGSPALWARSFTRLMCSCIFIEHRLSYPLANSKKDNQSSKDHTSNSHSWQKFSFSPSLDLFFCSFCSSLPPPIQEEFNDLI
jgi:hypothetical protein